MDKKQFYKEIQIEELDLSVRAYNGLIRSKAYTLADAIEKYNSGELFDIQYIGKKSIEEIRFAIEGFDLDDYICRRAKLEKWIEEKKNAIISASYEDIPIEKLKMPSRAYNALKRANVNTLAEAIEKSDSGELYKIQNIGVKTLKDIEETIKGFDIQEFQNGISEKANETNDEMSETSISTIIIEDHFTSNTLERPIADMHFSKRVENSFIRVGVKTINEMLKMHNVDYLQLKNCGHTSFTQIKEEISKLYKFKEGYFDKNEPEKEVEEFPIKEVDSELVKFLEDGYGFKTSWLMSWFNLTRQAIYNRLNKKVNQGRWRGRLLLEDEYEILDKMIKNNTYQKTVQEKIYYYLNNRKDNGIFIIVSDVEIKAFFLEDLPDALVEQIIDSKMNKLSEEEFTDAVSGRKISIMKEEYFVPSNMYAFNVGATRRGMNLEEYSQFLYGVSYSSNKQITDNKIIEFFNEHLVNGVVVISSDSENQWIRSYVSRNGYSLADFVHFYGYEYGNASKEMLESTFERHQTQLKEFVVDGHNTIYLPTESQVYTKLCLHSNNNGMKLDTYIEKLGYIRTFNRPIEIEADDESDMEIYPCEGSNIEKIFARYPLIGSYILSEASFESSYKKTKSFIDQKLKDNSTYFTIQVEMLITLVVVNYAKGWVSEENGKFWQHIALQYGYRDKGEQIRTILSNCIKHSLTHSHRWFYEDINGYQYKSTTVIHALTTKKTWMTVCDLLFEFYTNNLNWSYVENDPLVEQMVGALRNKFDASSDSEDSILISSRAYSFQEGVRKLILYRPKYAVVLFSRMLKRIDQLIKHTEKKAAYYEEYLCDEWIIQKISGITETRRSKANDTKCEVVLDYDRIRPAFRLENETDVVISIPDVRLKKTDFRRLELRIYDASELLYSRSLSSYGNELGKTMVGFSLSMKKDFKFRSHDDAFNFRIQIMCDDNELYNSGNSLYRDYIVFDGKNEAGINLTANKSYSIFVPADHTLECINGDKIIIDDTEKYSSYLLSLDKDFVISLDGNVIFLDVIKNSKLSIIAPKTASNMEFVQNQNKYKIIENNAVLHIIVPTADVVSKYYIMLNNKRVDMNALKQEAKGDSIIYHLNLDRDDDEICIQIKNISENRIVLRDFYKVIEKVDYNFNRKFYFSNADYIDCFLQINQVGNLAEREVKFSREDSCVSVPYNSGTLEFAIPKIRILDNRNKEWKGKERVWVKEIPQDLFMNIIAPSGIEPVLYLGEMQIYKDSDLFGVGNSIVKLNTKEMKKIRMSMVFEEQSYIVADIITVESFLETPKLWVENHKLLWNQGHGFFGNTDVHMKIKIKNGDGACEEYALDLQKDVINENVDYTIGEYDFSIVKKSENVFAQDEKVIANGIFVIGDVNELRFENKIVVIDTLTFEKKVTSRATGIEEYFYDSIPISIAYIDNIRFEKVEYIGSEEMECPIYTGILYYYFHGERHEYSFVDGVSSKGFPVEKINPIKMILVSENAMIINNPNGDGLYYYHYYDRYNDKTVYVLTDRIPNAKIEQFYEMTDLYSFRKERI